MHHHVTVYAYMSNMSNYANYCWCCHIVQVKNKQYLQTIPESALKLPITSHQGFQKICHHKQTTGRNDKTINKKMTIRTDSRTVLTGCCWLAVVDAGCEFSSTVCVAIKWFTKLQTRHDNYFCMFHTTKKSFAWTKKIPMSLSIQICLNATLSTSAVTFIEITTKTVDFINIEPYQNRVFRLSVDGFGFWFLKRRGSNV